MAKCTCHRDGNVLMWSSLLFLVPACKLPRSALKWMCGSLVLTSLWYHSGHDDIAKIVDMTTVRLVVLAATMTYVLRARRHDAGALMGLFGVLVVHFLPAFKACKGGPLVHWAHLLMHISGVIGLTRMCTVL